LGDCGARPAVLTTLSCASDGNMASLP
jgi:hypothetical protein